MEINKEEIEIIINELAFTSGFLHAYNIKLEHYEKLIQILEEIKMPCHKKKKK